MSKRQRIWPAAAARLVSAIRPPHRRNAYGFVTHGIAPETVLSLLAARLTREGKRPAAIAGNICHPRCETMRASSNASGLDFRDAAVAAASACGDATPAHPGGGDPWRSLPLCVDLDGTLLRTDVLHEQLLFAATHWGLLR